MSWARTAISGIVLAGCGGGGTTAGSGSCTGEDAVCASLPYGACVEVQQGPGHCVDWSQSGATPCTNVTTDCPATRPTGSFVGVNAGDSIALCIKASSIEYDTSAPTTAPGFCAASQTAIDASGAATCTPNPCGAGGYCSYIVNRAGASLVSCLWSI